MGFKRKRAVKEDCQVGLSRGKNDTAIEGEKMARGAGYVLGERTGAQF